MSLASRPAGPGEPLSTWTRMVFLPGLMRVGRLTRRGLFQPSVPESATSWPLMVNL